MRTRFPDNQPSTATNSLRAAVTKSLILVTWHLSLVFLHGHARGLVSASPTQPNWLERQQFTNSLRHWAQVSTYLRQQELKQQWNPDLLMSKARE